MLFFTYVLKISKLCLLLEIRTTYLGVLVPEGYGNFVFCVCVCVYGLETRKELDLRRVGPRHLCVRPP